MPIHWRWRRLPRCPSANFSRSRESPTDWLHARQNSGTRRLEPFPKLRTSLQPSSRLTQKNPQITQITLIEKIKKSVAHDLRFAFFKFPPTMRHASRALILPHLGDTCAICEFFLRTSVSRAG